MSNDETLHHLIGIQMSKTMLSMKRHIISEFDKMDSEMSFEDWMNLLPVLDSETISQKDLARILGKDKTTISRLVNQWEKHRFIERLKNTQDQRVNVLQMTKHAKKVHQRLRPLLEEADKDFTKNLSKSEIVQLTKTLEKIRAGLLNKG